MYGGSAGLAVLGLTSSTDRVVERLDQRRGRIVATLRRRPVEGARQREPIPQ